MDRTTIQKYILIIIGFLGLISCKTTPAKPSVYVETVKNLDALLDSTDLGGNYNGSILIADGENNLLEKSYGSSEPDKKPNRIDTRYDIASMGKMFTAVAIMQLMERGQLSLDQTLGDILPDYPNEEAKVITVEQLLSHTSGLGDFFGPEFDQNREAVKSLRDYLPFFVNDPLEFKPGERMRYSNAGFIVLGLMIENVSGTDYNTFIKSTIFDPAGMTSTGPLSSSAGGGDSTVNDLYKFALAFQSNQLLSQKSFISMTTDHFNNGYGYGMSLRSLNDKIIYGHNGGAPGISGELDMVKGEPLIIVTLSNRSPMDGWAQLRTNIRKAFFGNTPEIEQFLNTEKVVKTYREEGLEQAKIVLAELDNNISDRNTFDHAEQYAMNGQPEKAVDILELIVQAYPGQWYPYSFLADFQLQAGQRDEAIKSYKKSLELNPKNEQAIQQLKNLQQ